MPTSEAQRRADCETLSIRLKAYESPQWVVNAYTEGVEWVSIRGPNDDPDRTPSAPIRLIGMRIGSLPRNRGTRTWVPASGSILVRSVLPSEIPWNWP